MTAKIVEIPCNNLADIPEMLRALADKIEAFEYGEVADIRTTVVVLHHSDGRTTVRSYGPASDYYYTVATLDIAKSGLVRNLIDG